MIYIRLSILSGAITPLTPDTHYFSFFNSQFSILNLTRTSTALLTSGTDVYNYTKLPYEFENQYLYTYIIELYKKIYLRKIGLEYKKEKTQNKYRFYIYK